ncbi:hypothetical protein [Pengzhenrongella frigida]|uniref:Uncharacterized protein n=1 Tax=Pengzhenrongella frigida TaxID=1259133 RepID=A0A4Q5N2I7_9MICO|nr:hypothetical protein [Cellulomonas sp. HLT2-17]RYV52335.1 hypothetical protein EUA98_03770 [Cellulomonas sp. HLT2-17]
MALQVGNSTTTVRAGDLNDTYVGLPFAMEIGQADYFLKIEGIRRILSVVRIFVGVPVGPRGEIYLDVQPEQLLNFQPHRG